MPCSKMRESPPTPKGMNRTGMLLSHTGSKTGNGDSIYGKFWGNDIPGQDKIVDYLNEGNTGITDSTNLQKAKSLVRVSDVENKYFVPAYNFYKHLEEVITKFNAATNNKSKYRIEIQGFASKHGYTESNRILAENRAAVIEGFIPAVKNITEIQNYEEIENKELRTVTGSTEENFYKEYYDTSKSDDYENQTYDNEYTYFKQINENDDMVKRYISDKVDYFDPAFHSITPEGFNARLTFLQQCVRQGPTISASDLGMGSAYGAGNLSFGRAPFCVLRIGDFFNTKICIQSINIEYDNNGSVQWDLNPEGVGLQPMFANINITFTFLGGSDISGPIARLQHAASFNYYANASVYDRRADYREAYVTPEEDEAMSWSPVLLNKDEDANVISHLPFYTRKPKTDTETNKQ